MPNFEKQTKFIVIVSANPELPWDKAALQAGYSRKRAKTVASLMRRNPRVMEKIAAIRNRTLQAAPTIESCRATRNAAKEMALRHADSTSASWILFQISQAELRELEQQSDPKPDNKPPHVKVSFVDTLLPAEEAIALNKSAAQYEAMVGMPAGTMGRLQPEPHVIQEPPALKPAKAKAATKDEPDRWLRCEQHGKFWNVATCPTCDALRWQEEAYNAMAKAGPVVN